MSPREKRNRWTDYRKFMWTLVVLGCFGAAFNELLEMVQLRKNFAKLKWRFEPVGEVMTIPKISDGVLYLTIRQRGLKIDPLCAVDVKTGREKWTFLWTRAQHLLEARSSPPALSDGVVYFTVGESGGDNSHLCAVDAKTGQEKWTVKLEGFNDSTPAISDGVVYFGTDDSWISMHQLAYRYQEAGRLDEALALHEKGIKRNEARLGDNHVDTLNSLWWLANAYDDAGRKDEERKIREEVRKLEERTITRPPYDQPKSNLYAVDAKTGEKAWMSKFDWIDCSNLVISDGVIYFKGFHTVHAVDCKTGEVKWKFKTGGSVFSSLAISDGVVYFGCLESRSGERSYYAVDAKTGQKRGSWGFRRSAYSYALRDGLAYGSRLRSFFARDATTGQEKWEFKTESRIEASGIAGGVFYLADSDNLYAVDAKEGQEKWRFPWDRAPLRIQSGSRSPAISDGVVYFGDYDNLYALDAKEGKEKWRFPWDWDRSRHSSTAPLTVSDGVVYFKGQDANVYAVAAEIGQE